ncbi:MAG: hypothetical protein KF884_01230 [Fimbriimonadaceae bacterium]|nr:hypothetical protein [Fimbriimonadaceae bacterium]QYK58719.1 MAG: hypothetical protein KF884_01230 [Fimbriimonadaceae bacterium]
MRGTRAAHTRHTVWSGEWVESAAQTADNDGMAKLKPGLIVGGLSGTSGGAVFALRRDGTTIVRERPVPSSRVTQAQAEARRLMALASSLWRGLSPEEQRAWLLWARRTDPVAGPVGAANAYRSLAVRWLAVNREDTVDMALVRQRRPSKAAIAAGLSSSHPGALSFAERGGEPWPTSTTGKEARSASTGSSVGLEDEPPTLPPASPFGGDAARLAVEGLAGALRYTSDRPNSSGVVTELLGLSVRSALAEPRDRDFRVLERVAFVPGGLSAEVAAKPGRYAVAARYVLRATGQATGVLRLGVVEVG